MLEVSSFIKTYKGYTVLDVPELHIPAGVSWFQGINGSGKSTFFKSISGIIPFEGEVFLDQSLSLKKSPLEFRRQINYSFAEPRYPEFVSGKEILDYYRSVYEWPQERLEELIDLFGVRSFYGSRIGTYSSGMLKKISLISVFAGTPRILALDEPFTTIDTATQEILLERLRECLAQGQSIFIASHHDWPQYLLATDHHFKVENRGIYAVS